MLKPQDLLDMIEILSKEKSMPVEIIFSAVEQALREATRRHYEDKNNISPNIKLVLNATTGLYLTYRLWTVVPDDATEIEMTDERMEVHNRRAGRGDKQKDSIISEDGFESFDADVHIRLSDAQKNDPDMQAGDFHETEIKNITLDRIAVQHARQIIYRHLRQAERLQVIEEYSDKQGELINGIVDRLSRDGYVVLLKDKVEAILPYNLMVGEERFRAGDQVRAILQSLDTETKNYYPQLILSRIDDKMLLELFKLEVPEVSEHIIEILSVARVAGSRSKIAVKTNDGRIDPVGVCVGMRGARVSAVTNQINGERVDIILWDDDPEKFVSNALSPAKIETVFQDKRGRLLEVVVMEDNLASAVGSKGENVRLASKLIGWEIRIITTDEAVERKAEIDEQTAVALSEDLDITVDQAHKLVGGGLSELENIFNAKPADIAVVAGIDDATSNSIVEKAGQLLMMLAMSDEEEMPQIDPGFLEIEGMNKELALRFNDKDIKTVADLAECSIDELLDIAHITEKSAGALIMAARRSWAKQS